MRKLLIALLAVFAGCKSVDMLTLEQSQKIIDQYKPQLEQNDKLINSKSGNFPSGNDIILGAGIQPLNRIMQIFSNNRNDDISLYFGYSPNILKEEKSVLGIKYTNHINIDSGFVYLNIKSLKIDKFEKSRLNAVLEIEGFGKVGVSGKYLGIPAGITPDVQLYLNEPVSFDLIASSQGVISLKPLPKKLILKAKVKINLLGWDVPWYQEIPLELAELVKPIQFPIALKSEIQFPLPASKSGDQKIEYAPYLLEMNNASVEGQNTKIIYRTNIDFKKK